MKHASNRMGVREAKARLSQILRRVKGGETVDITEYGTPIARLVPVEDGSLSHEEVVERMRKEGLLVRGWRKSSGAPKPLRVSKGASVSDLLRKDREEG